jgi:hypothetical protein
MSERPVRIQRKRAKGWKMPENTVCVDRSTKWGNPWRVGEPHYPDAAAATLRFRSAVLGSTHNGTFCPPIAHPNSYIGTIIHNAPKELRGKNLACFCPLDQPCHADVLLELANAQGGEHG